MIKCFWPSFGLIIVLMSREVILLNNGLALKPPMGWMSWGYYMCAYKCKTNPEKCLNEKLILDVADAFYNEGYQEVGYEYIIIDDCWAERWRDAFGRLTPDRERFPRGMKFLADYIHSKGLKFGMYTNIADVTCMNYPGSRNYFDIDAQTFADWGVDYLKVDGCFVKEDYLNHAYIDLLQSLNKTGRPMVYSCSWPYYIEFIIKKPFDLSRVKNVCNVWRNYHDIYPNKYNLLSVIRFFSERYTEFSQNHGPGGWNDPDMLIFGSNLTMGHKRLQLATYSVLSAPLLLSCNMNLLTAEEKQLLLNADLAAVAQDPAGEMAQPFMLLYDVMIWLKKHSPKKGDTYNSYSVTLSNLSSKSAEVTFVPEHYGLDCPDGYTVLDTFARKYIRNVTVRDSIVMYAPAEDAIIYSLFPL